MNYTPEQIAALLEGDDDKGGMQGVDKKCTDQQKRLIATLWDDTKVYAVNGEHVRDHCGAPKFIGGGHGYVYDFIRAPDGSKNEIWVEAMPGEDNTIAHEIIEYIMMRYLGYQYDKAHHCAESAENAIRHASQSQPGV